MAPQWDVAVLFFVALVMIACLSSWTTSTTLADPRATVVREFCNKTRDDGPEAVWANNFVVALENLNSDLEQKGWGGNFRWARSYYVLCARAMSWRSQQKVDCTLCYSEIRSLLPKCYPEIGGRIYLDGCFMRYANYSFFDEVMDSLDTSVCSSSKHSSDQQGFSSSVNDVLSNATYLAVKSNKFFENTQESCAYLY